MRGFAQPRLEPAALNREGEKGGLGPAAASVWLARAVDWDWSVLAPAVESVQVVLVAAYSNVAYRSGDVQQKRSPRVGSPGTAPEANVGSYFRAAASGN